jgi:hypothetical protein
MPESIDLVLRKSLDAVDRRRKLLTALTIVLTLFAVFCMLAMNSVHDLHLQLIAGFTALAVFICAHWCFDIAISTRNTAAILKAIALLSDSRK